MIKVGHKVIVGSFKNMPATVSRIYILDSKEQETKWAFEGARIMLDIEWPHGHGKSRVSMSDENKYWHRYSEAN